MQSGIGKALDLLEADGRRKLTEDERARVAGLWESEFSSVSSEDLHAAVLTFCREKRVGRPTIGELWGILKRGTHKPSAASIRMEDTKKQELLWASSILEFPSRWQGAYQHTVDYAERVLRHNGYSHWHDAMAAINPGWTPPSTSEAIL